MCDAHKAPMVALKVALGLQLIPPLENDARLYQLIGPPEKVGFCISRAVHVTVGRMSQSGLPWHCRFRAGGGFC